VATAQDEVLYIGSLQQLSIQELDEMLVYVSYIRCNTIFLFPFANLQSTLQWSNRYVLWFNTCAEKSSSDDSPIYTVTYAVAGRYSSLSTHSFIHSFIYYISIRSDTRLQ
jgi:hypothetical protein